MRLHDSGSMTISGAAIPSSVTYIGERAFLGCESPKDIVIPESLTDIGNEAFYCRTGLARVSYRGTEADREQISIGDGNECLTDAQWICE